MATKPIPGLQSGSDFSLAIASQACVDRCDVLAQMTERGGEITRRFLTPPMQLVHHQLTTWAGDLNLASRVDRLGNWFAKRPSNRPAAKTLLIGSHLDTVPNGGRFDGPLGVTIGLAVVEAISDRDLPFHVQVVGFSEEEGVRYGIPYLGSRCVTGTFNHDWLSRVDDTGTMMRKAIEDFGLSATNIGDDCFTRDSVLAFIEPHIEQGAQLNLAELPVGIITAIAGQSRITMRFDGVPGHAGTTPMHQRNDAMVAAARVMVDLTDYATQVDDLRFTFGRIEAFPNARNVIAGRVELTADIRHAKDAVRLEAVERLSQRGKKIGSSCSVSFEIVEHEQQPAIEMDSNLREILEHSIADIGIDLFSMSSGAGHDAAVMAEAFPTGMLFLRQPKPISHHPDEDVDVEDVASGIQVLINAIDRLAQQHEIAEDH